MAGEKDNNNNDVLNDGKTLRDYGIDKNKTYHLVIKLKRNKRVKK